MSNKILAPLLLLVSLDSRMHEAMLRKFPRLVPRVDSLLEAFLGFVGHPLLAILLVLVGGPLVNAEVISLSNALYVLFAWGISLAWFSRNHSVKKLSVPLRLFVTTVLALVLGFGGASFARWSTASWKSHHENKNPVVVAPQSPDFSGEINSIALGEYVNNITHKEHAISAIEFSIANRAGIASGANNFRVFMELDNGSRFEGMVPVGIAGTKNNEMPLTDGNKKIGKIILDPNNYMPDLAAHSICTGCSISGWIRMVFYDVEDERELYKHKADVVIEFNDIATGKLHSIKKPLGPEGIHVPGNDI